MSVSLTGLLMKHGCILPPQLKKHIEDGPCVTNGTYYLIPVERSFHYDYLTTGSTKYAEYLEAANDTASHSVEKFKSLHENFDLSKFKPIEANGYGHSIQFWVQDGNHRLAILKTIFPNGRIPISFVNVTLYSETQDELKAALRATVGHVHGNGWNNRLEFGYHSFQIYNFNVQGQRNPVRRHEKLKPFYDLTDKQVLDLGCNTGGMLFHASQISKGVGIDFDQKCIDSCNIFKKRLNLGCELDFVQGDLNKTSLRELCDTYSLKPDIIFMLSLGSWVANWEGLYRDAYSLVSVILFETNNDRKGEPQLELFKRLGAIITLVSDNSDDDCTGNHGRKMYLIKKPTKLFLQYPDDAHVKNKESILRMCAAAGFTFEATNDRGRLLRADYDYLWLPMFWVSPDEIPERARIIYGPHHSIFPQGALVGPLNERWARRCVYTTLSDWNMGVFREFAPETSIPLKPLMFGIQTLPDVRVETKTNDCLIYFKRRDPADLAAARVALKVAGLKSVEFSYGSYKQQDYLEALKRSKFALWIGSHESQGFAFQEAMAMNVPILCWDATSMFDEFGSYKEYRGSKNLYATTATVWSSLCGERILRAYELPAALAAIQRNLDGYRPQEEIMRRCSDAITIKAIVDHFE
jgi:SAM-dependent methyltransferase